MVCQPASRISQSWLSVNRHPQRRRWQSVYRASATYALL
jgi:hypothetical protein